MKRGIPPVVLETLLLFAVAFGPLAFGCVEPWSLAILEIALFSMLFFRFLGRTPDPGRTIHRTILPGVLAVALLGLIQRLNPVPITAPHGLMPFTASGYETGKALVLWCALASLLWCAPSVLSALGAAKRFLWLVFLLGFIVAVIGIIQLSHGNTAVYGFRPVRYGRSPFGPYFNRGHAASMMSLSLLVGCGLLLSRFARLKRDLAMGARLSDFVATQAVILCLLSVIGLGILLARNRGSLVSIAVSVWAMAFLSTAFLTTRRRRWAARGGLALALVALAFASPRLIGLVHGAQLSVPYRISMLRGGLRMLADYPLWGTGLGSVVSAFHPYKEPLVQGIVDHVHNDWLELLLQAGIVGFAAYAAVLALFGRAVYRAWMASPSREERCLTGGAVAAALAFVIHGFVEFSFQIPANAVLFFAILAWLGAQDSRAGGAAAAVPPSQPGMRNHPAGYVLATGALGLILLAGRPGIAYAYSCRVKSVALEKQPALWAKAYDWDHDPAHLYGLGATWLDLSEARPASRQILLRRALESSQRALRLDPLNEDFRYLEGAILWRLNRIGDAKSLLPAA